MKYIILGIILLLLILAGIFIHLRKKWAKNKVKSDTIKEKLVGINEALKPFGFCFDLEQDIIVSKNNSWQRNFGYMDLYDLKAPILGMVMDCEPIYFDYDYKHYRIEFWKGQYGITTGAEVGIYVRDFASTKPSGIYRSANDNEVLDISFNLYKQCFLFSRNNFSWWLSGFDVGNFTKPKHLKMWNTIRFPNIQMQTAFIAGLLNAGYSESKIYICNNEVSFCYSTPHNYKLNKNHRFIKKINLFFNHINCNIYNYITRDFNSTIDKLDYIRYLAPFMYKLLVCKCLIKRKK